MKTNKFNRVLENKKEYHHIMCDNEPVETFHSREEAESHLDKWKKDHPGKQFIIEKGRYQDDNDMLDKLDEMSDNLENESKNINENMKKPKTIKEAIEFAKKRGLKRVKINENIYDVDECWKNMEEEDDFSNGNYLNDVYEDEECDECGDGQMNEFDDIWDDGPHQIKGLGFNDDGELYGFDNDSDECPHCEGFGQDEGGDTCHNCGGKGHVGGNPYEKDPTSLKDFEGHQDFTLDDEIDNEGYEDEEYEDEIEEQVDFDDEDDRYPEEEDPDHMDLPVPRPCSHCHGTGENQFGSVCKKCKGKKHEIGRDKFSSYHKSPREHYNDISNIMGEPSLNESKRTVRLTENEFAKVIKKIVKESIPGISIPKKSREDSGKENNQHLKDVDKKMKDYLSFEGNDNPEFPHHIGKGKNTKEVVKFNNNDEEDEYVADNRGMGLQDVKYDHEPSEQFKARIKKALEGDSTMGNSQKSPNVIKTKTGENIGKVAKRKKKEIEDEPMYEKDVQPVKVVKESIQKKVILENEIEKMKKLYSYNKKSQ